jgi:pimeloyl-ACP methyl ester carboxylesterase
VGPGHQAAVAHDGSTIEVEVHGSGPPILVQPFAIVSGAPPEHHELKAALDRALVDSLGDRYSLVTFDYPGRRAKPRTLTPGNVVRDLLAVADVAGADRFGWCGYSVTATWGLQLALASNRVDRLIIGGWPPVGGPFREMLSFALDHPENFEWCTKDDYQSVMTFYRDLQDFDDRAVVDRIICPRLCFVGGADDIYELAIAPRIVREQKSLERLGWDIRVLDGLDHMQPLDPPLFASVVSDWLP